MPAMRRLIGVIRPPTPGEAAADERDLTMRARNRQPLSATESRTPVTTRPPSAAADQQCKRRAGEGAERLRELIDAADARVTARLSS